MNNELLADYRSAAAEFNRLCGNLKPEEMDWAQAPGKWSIRQLIFHTLDAELVGSFRIRKVLAEEKPYISAFDQDAWVANLKHTLNPQAVGHTLLGLSQTNLALLSELSQEQWARIGLHEERGEMTLQAIVTHHSRHIAHHAQGITQILESRRA